MDEFYRPQDHLYPEANETITSLRQQGYIVAIVSNRDKPYDDYLTQKGLFDQVNFSLAAGEINCWKPGVEIFIHAANLAKVNPADVVYIGDNYYADIVGARNAGLRPILFDPNEIFPNPDCLVMKTHSQVFELLERM